MFIINQPLKAISEEINIVNYIFKYTKWGKPVTSITTYTSGVSPKCTPYFKLSYYQKENLVSHILT